MKGRVPSMKTWPILFTIVCWTLAGCGSSENYFSTNFQVNRPMFASVGGSMIEWEEGVRSKSGREVTQATRYELLYSGLQGRTVSITYREYSTGEPSALSRPAFSQELKYELAQEGKTIVTFREVRIEVSEATNERIGFMVSHGPAGMRVTNEQFINQKDEQTPAEAYPK
jgi:hypothetical protein